MSFDLDQVDYHLEHAAMENDIDVEVNVGEEALEEAAAEAVEEHAEIADPVAEQAEDVAEDEVTEMMFRHIDHMQVVIAKHGCSRDIIAAFDTNGSLTKMIESRMGTSIYVESLDATGDPNSAMTIATLEGLGEMAKKAWEWIKKIFKKIFAFMGRLVAAVMTRFSKAEKSIGRLRREYEARTDDADAVKNSKKEIYNPTKTNAYGDAIGKAVNKLNSFESDVLAKAKDLMNKASAKNPVDQTSAQANALDATIKAFEKLIEDCDKKKKAVNEGKVNISTIKWGAIPGYLQELIKANGFISTCKNSIEKTRMEAKQASATADRLSSLQLDGDKSADIKAAREAARGLNRGASLLGKIVSHLVTMQGMGLSMVNARIMLGKKVK